MLRFVQMEINLEKMEYEGRKPCAFLTAFIEYFAAEKVHEIKTTGSKVDIGNLDENKLRLNRAILLRLLLDPFIQRKQDRISRQQREGSEG